MVVTEENAHWPIVNAFSEVKASEGVCADIGDFLDSPWNDVFCFARSLPLHFPLLYIKIDCSVCAVERYHTLPFSNIKPEMQENILYVGLQQLLRSMLIRNLKVPFILLMRPCNQLCRTHEDEHITK